jgi:hypothetical protein
MNCPINLVSEYVYPTLGYWRNSCGAPKPPLLKCACGGALMTLSSQSEGQLSITGSRVWRVAHVDASEEIGKSSA